MQSKKLNLNLSIPAIATDGCLISINNDSGDTSFIFFQVSPQQDPDVEEVPANAVSNVRLTLAQLKELQKQIATSLEVFEKQQDKKPQA